MSYDICRSLCGLLHLVLPSLGPSYFFGYVAQLSGFQFLDKGHSMKAPIPKR